MKYKTSGIVIALVLAGCARQDYLAKELPMLEGQPLAQAVRYLGSPTEKNKTAGGMTYSWVNHQSGSFYVPEEAPYPVVVSNSGGHPAVVFTQPSPLPMHDTYDWHCRLDIVADKGVITHTTYDGNTAGCQIFSDKLKPLVTAVENK